MNDETPQQQTVSPDAVDELFDQADVYAILQQHGRALDAHRKEMLLLWLSVCLIAGLLTYQFGKELRLARLPD